LPHRSVGDGAIVAQDSQPCQLLDVLERVPIQHIRAEHALSEASQALSALLIARLWP
jgi:hypothetical protein